MTTHENATYLFRAELRAIGEESLEAVEAALAATKARLQPVFADNPGLDLVAFVNDTDAERFEDVRVVELRFHGKRLRG